MAEIKFTSDVMLGGFTKLMRMMGFDTIYFNNWKLEELINLSVKEGRIFITKRMKFPFPQNLSFLRIPYNYPHEQVEAVLLHFKIKPDPSMFLTRCLICNEKLMDVEKERVKGIVPPFVYQTHEEFAQCPSCKRIYWMGTHQENMRKMVERFYRL